MMLRLVLTLVATAAARLAVPPKTALQAKNVSVAHNASKLPVQDAATVEEITREGNSTERAKGAAMADQIAEKAAKKAEQQAAQADPEDSFPTDWMKAENVMKYDIDADPMTKRIESSEADTETQHKLNLKNVDLVQKRRS